MAICDSGCLRTQAEDARASTTVESVSRSCCHHHHHHHHHQVYPIQLLRYILCTVYVLIAALRPADRSSPETARNKARAELRTFSTCDATPAAPTKHYTVAANHAQRHELSAPASLVRVVASAGLSPDLPACVRKKDHPPDDLEHAPALGSCVAGQAGPTRQAETPPWPTQTDRQTRRHR
ncbi:hypothetical protein VTN02DRAFT_3312 [Thermoascus thermophilus]